MFFIGVFGVESKFKEIKLLNNLTCIRCNKVVTAKLIKKFEFFHFFFIPIFKWNIKYYVQCENCNAIFTISKDKGKAIESGEEIEITYWDLNEAEDYINYNHKCLNCGREVEKEYRYCPYCGGKMK